MGKGIKHASMAESREHAKKGKDALKKLFAGVTTKPATRNNVKGQGGESIPAKGKLLTPKGNEIFFEDDKKIIVLEPGNEAGKFVKVTYQKPIPADVEI